MTNSSLHDELHDELSLHHDEFHVEHQRGVGRDGALAPGAIPGQGLVLAPGEVAHPRSEEMVSLALWPLVILAIPSSHPAITSFLPGGNSRLKKIGGIFFLLLSLSSNHMQQKLSQLTGRLKKNED